MLTDTLIRLRTLRAHISALRRGSQQWRSFGAWRNDGVPPRVEENPLLKYFREHQEGRGIWKFNHYFQAYERHFSRFRGREVHVLEIGVYSGGSLDMWRTYFGPKSRIYGVDIEPACKAYESDGVKILIGDQADRSFWQRARLEVPDLDIVIDDGGHAPEQQIVTLEELLPHLRPGGIYICEDVLQPLNEFSSYVCGMLQNLNAMEDFQQHPQDAERRSVIRAGGLQSGVGAIHLYPYMTVIERSDERVSELVAPKHGTQWEPFLK